jgi:hypothetical protein
MMSRKAVSAASYVSRILERAQRTRKFKPGFEPERKVLSPL